MIEKNVIDHGEKIFEEKRHPILCANCETEMVCMNKYTLLKDNRKAYVWYICPRRKKGSEKGCGHKTPVEIKRIMRSKEAEPIFAFKLVGEVRSSDGITMFIQDNLESFGTWLHRNKEKFKNKKVGLTMQIIEEKEEA